MEDLEKNIPEETVNEEEQSSEVLEEVEITEMSKLQEDLNEAKKKQEEYLEIAQRLQADFENYKKRNINLRKDSYNNGKVDIIKDIIPIIDNFEIALKSMQDTKDENILIGVKMIYNQILELLNKNGIKEINRLGQVFDPQLEEAVAQGTIEEGEPGTVCEVLRKGYIYEANVIRHSMVRVIPE